MAFQELAAKIRVVSE